MYPGIVAKYISGYDQHREAWYPGAPEYTYSVYPVNGIPYWRRFTTGVAAFCQIMVDGDYQMGNYPIGMPFITTLVLYT